MNKKTMKRILSELSYTRVSGSKEEKECADRIQSICSEMGFEARLEPFEVLFYNDVTSKLIVDGKEIKCKSYFGSSNGHISAPFYYLEDTSKASLSNCKDKIVLIDSSVGYKLYNTLLENGVKGFITYSGSVNGQDLDIDRRELRFEHGDGPLGVAIHVSDALDIVRSHPKNAEITVEQTVEKGTSYNVILELDGESDENVIFTAHYDSTCLSSGAYDNMSGCIALLALAEYFASVPRRRGVKFVWCGSEERGLIGSRMYCKAHQSELSNTVLNINLDMLGSIMGGFVGFSCVNESMTEFMEKEFSKHRIKGTVRYGIRSSDSNSFVYNGVPAVSFARYAPLDTAPIHTRYDTVDAVCPDNLLTDIENIKKFTKKVIDSEKLPFSLEISEKIKNDVEEYMTRNRYTK